MNVLIVDDSLTVRMDLAEAFQDAGFETTLCASAAEARAALARALPSVIVLDVVLPDADGVEFLGSLRADPITSAIPTILLSGEAAVKDRLRGLAQGADEYVGKPYDADYVVARAAALYRAQSQNDDSRHTVLVIDDSLTCRAELAERLRDAGYHAILAASGEEGLRKASDLRPDAIVVDGMMPGMDGTTMVRRLRLDPGLCTIPCILLTGAETHGSEVLALDSGADAFVRKSEDDDVLLARLAATLRAPGQAWDRAHATTLMGPKRILAIDPDPAYLDQIAPLLRGEGFEVVRAHTGEDALELLAVESADCILLNFRLPGCSGLDTCARIKGTPLLRHVPLLILTANEDADAMIDAMNAGADDFVSKSVSFEVLRARVHAQLRRKQFEDDSRRIRDEMMVREAQADASRKVAQARKVLLDELSDKNEQLNFHVQELQRLNDELKVFAYSVSHDLRQPLRGMDGFSRALLEQYHDALDDQGRHYLQRVRSGAERMGQLIDGLLVLSRVSRAPLTKRAVHIDQVAHAIVQRLRDAEPDRQVEVEVAEDIVVQADPRLLESLLENLLGNAWKFTANHPDPRIELGILSDAEPHTFFVRDNGVGFDMKYAEKLFGPFQRLHDATSFEGTGVGLATAQRVVHRHGGRVWADSIPERGATFFFTLSGEL